jgi:hypothetical protein
MICTLACACEQADYRDLYADTWVATDALGRSLPTYEEVGPPREDRIVVLFYFLWLGQHGTEGPFDLTELLKENPDNPQYGPPGRLHHWGKPLLLGLTLRYCWAWTSGRDTWNWLESWPQQYGWYESPDKPEQVSVSVAQHPTTNIGRSHFNNRQPQIDVLGVGPDTHKGLYFGQQWERGLEIDSQFLFITGWNEWVAQRFVRNEGQDPFEFLGQPLKAGGSFFVDAYNQEYSRDIEPMKGGYGDNYFYQMVEGRGFATTKACAVPNRPAEPKRLRSTASLINGPMLRPNSAITAGMSSTATKRAGAMPGGIAIPPAATTFSR